MGRGVKLNEIITKVNNNKVADLVKGDRMQVIVRWTESGDLVQIKNQCTVLSSLTCNSNEYCNSIIAYSFYKMEKWKDVNHTQKWRTLW